MWGWLTRWFSPVVGEDPAEDPYEGDDMAQFVIREAWRTGRPVIGCREKDGTITIHYGEDMRTRKEAE